MVSSSPVPGTFQGLSLREKSRRAVQDFPATNLWGTLQPLGIAVKACGSKADVVFTNVIRLIVAGRADRETSRLM
jgi:hypothetical protein